MFDRTAIHGLYVITDCTTAERPPLPEQIELAITGGATVVQYRNIGSDTQQQYREAAALKQISQHYKVPLIINDHIELAHAIGADGIHLGRTDNSLVKARERLGEQALIGISCYNQLDIAILAEQQGADYVAFGSFFQSPTKPEATNAVPSLLREARQRLSIPVVAIGGITPANGATLIAAGAMSLAVISGVFAQPDIRDAARAYTRLFRQAD